MSGIWNGTPISSQYGGTGQNFSTALRGYLPFFSATGTWGTLPTGSAGSLLQTNGAGADPSWTGSPTIAGTNISAIPPPNLAAGTLPANVVVNDASITSISAAKVSGNIAGNAGGLSNLLPLSGLAAGTLPTSIPASSITATGVAPGVYGGAAQTLTANVRSDGRLNSISQQNIVLPPAQISAGALPAGVTLPAASVSAGNLGASVVATSVAPTGVSPGTYGGNPGRTLTFTVANDGRLSAASQQNIVLVPSQLSAGALPSNVSVPAANLTAGLLGGDVIAQRLAPTGVSSGTYGGPTQSAQITISTDGRITQAAQYYQVAQGHVIGSLLNGTTNAFPREPNLMFDGNQFTVTDDPQLLSTIIRNPSVCQSVPREVPSGMVNGINDTFYLAHTPKSGAEYIFINGIQQNSGLDYTIVESTITFTPASIPQTGFYVNVNYCYPTSEPDLNWSPPMKINGSQIQDSTIDVLQLVEALKRPIQSTASGGYKKVVSIEYNPTTGDLRVSYEE